MRNWTTGGPHSILKTSSIRYLDQADQTQYNLQGAMFKKIAFIHYPTQDLVRALKFYRDVLGLELHVQTEEWVEFKVGDQRLALRQVDAMPPQSAGAMIWLEARPIEEIIPQLKAKNVKFIEELETYSYGKTATFEDPDGNRLGLYEPPDKK